MAPYTKPEAVLKQAEGLIQVGQSTAALQSLTEVFASKRFRSTPLASLEPIMLRIIELSVEMRRGRTAKESLMQFKNVAQNSSVPSIELVIKKFISLADAKVIEAQEKAERAVAVDVDDLEASETPEDVLLGAVSGDQNKDRTDRALVTPWLKFSWESYRTALETLKNNARLEAIYQVMTSSLRLKEFQNNLMFPTANCFTSFQVLSKAQSESRIPTFVRDSTASLGQCCQILSSNSFYQSFGS